MRWVNPRQPQTLYIGTVLLYFDAVFSVLFRFSGLTLLLGMVAVAAAAGIANDKRLAWYAGVAVSAITPLLVLWLVWNDGIDQLFSTRTLINLVFPIAQFAALIHPMSSNHVRTWFE